MQVSIILCTKNGGDRLTTCLKHLEALKTPDTTQLLLVDNGSTDGVSFENLQAFARRSRLVCDVTQELKPGNSAGRNVAIAKATGDLLLFIDDDCYVDPDFADQWIEVFTRDPSLGFGSGMIRRHSPEQDALGCIESPEPRLTEPRQFVRNGFIQGSNMAFRRTCLAAAGKFDERFGAGTPFAGEEWEVAIRASFHGWGGGYFPGPKVSHDHRRGREEARERYLYYAFGAGGVFAKSIKLHRGSNRRTCIYGMARELLRHARDIEYLHTLLRGYLALKRHSTRG